MHGLNKKGLPGQVKSELLALHKRASKYSRREISLLKARKKVISILVTLAMLVSLMVPFAGAAVAASDEIVNISAGYIYTDNDKDDVDLGAITVTKDDDYGDYSVSVVYMTVTLPDGVEFNTTPSISGKVVGASDSEITLEQDATAIAAETKIFDFTLKDSYSVDIKSDVTGEVNAKVKVWGEDASGSILWETTENVTIAKITDDNVTVSAEAAESVEVGSDQEAAKITVEESNPGALEVGDTIKFTIKADGVEWDVTGDTPGTNKTKVVASGITLKTFDSENFQITDSDNKVLYVEVAGSSTSFDGKIEVTPILKVKPEALDGDIEIKVSGDVDETTEVVVATVGEGVFDVEVKDADKDTIYLGQVAKEFDDVEITIDPSSDIEDGDYLTLTLPEGLKWAIEDIKGTEVAADTLVKLENGSGTSIEGSSDQFSVEGTYDDDKSLWITCNGKYDADKDIVIKNLFITADADAELGDLELTFGGFMDGTAVIGEVASPITVDTDMVTVEKGISDQGGNDIFIKEVEDGVLQKNAVVKIKLPMGFEFADEPKVTIDEGDLSVGTKNLEEDIFEFDITSESNVDSVIKLEDIRYDVSNGAAGGDNELKIYINDMNNPVARVPFATVKGEDVRNTAGFVVGSTTYTVNGTEYIMDAAAYVKNGRTYLPVRYVAYALGVNENNVYYDAATKTVTLLKGTTAVQLTIGSTTLKVNGITLPMDVAPEVTDGRTMLPARFVAEALGYEVGYDEATKTVTLK